ncbi:hypothetical protein [Mycoplasma seminis]|uniref:Transmembrane protein n=1 Tax=Mycoplasma seminis TaxID=512749 RepID=A0ABY9H9X7_9MOLU|nr:hypothetical protein [Mycoplasma seminis]WLP85301.1 hypothetical protein Q8852_03185 [Mycoplasma seminis]
MSKFQKFRWYWLPAWAPYIIGLLLFPLIISIYAYKLTDKNTYFVITIIFSIIVSLAFVSHLVNWLFNFKHIFKINSAVYEYNEKQMIKQHPFWKPLRFMFNIFLGMGEFDPHLSMQDSFFSMQKWEGKDSSQLDDYLKYKDYKNCKKLYWLAYILPFLFGLGTSIIISEPYTVHGIGYKLFGAWIFAPMCGISGPLIFITCIVYGYMACWMTEIVLNRIPDLDPKQKLKLYQSAHIHNKSYSYYQKTINSQKFKQFIQKQKTAQNSNDSTN